MANKKTNKKTEYRVRDNGNFYVVEHSLDGGKTWHFTDSSTNQEEANKKMENLKNGLTAAGLTQEEAKASIPEGAKTIGDDSDSKKNSKNKSIAGMKRNPNAPVIGVTRKIVEDIKSSPTTSGLTKEEESDIADKEKIEIALDAKDEANGEYIVDDDELVQRREDARKKGDKEEEKKIQAEINRRNQTGELDSKYSSNTTGNDFKIGTDTQPESGNKNDFPAIAPIFAKENTIELNEKQVKEMFGIDPNELPSKDEKDDPKFSNAIGYRDSLGFIKIDPNKITDNEELIHKIKNDYRYGLGNEFLKYYDGSYVITDDDLNSWILNNQENTDLKRIIREIINTRKILKGQPQKKKNQYWTNFLYGNDIGSTKKEKDPNKEAADNKEHKMDNFIKNNPNMIKAIFGKNSGLNFGERVARLGEMLAMIGADATRGAYAGFNNRELPEVTNGRYSKIYNDALKNQYERKKDVFKSENKATIDKANRLSIITSSPILKNLPSDILDIFADRTVVGLSEEEWNNIKNKLERNGYEYDEINEIKRTYNALRNTYSDITDQRTNVVELNGKEFDLMRKPQQAINELEAQKRILKEKLLEIDSMPFEKLTDFMTDFKSIYSGIQSVSNSMSENENFKYSLSFEGKLGIPFGKDIGVGANAGKDRDSGSEKSTETQIDKMALEGLAAGKTTAEEWNSATKKSKNALKASIQAAIDEIDEQIKALKKFHSIDDGIVKAPHMKQWIVREDGTRIELNPNDNIYATKNKLTTKKDNSKEDIVPMEKEDKVIVIQKKLGYDGSKRIIKNNDYYLSKLK